MCIGRRSATTGQSRDPLHGVSDCGLSGRLPEGRPCTICRYVWLVLNSIPFIRGGELFTHCISTRLGNRLHIRLVLLSEPLRSQAKKPPSLISHSTQASQGQHVTMHHTSLMG